MFGTCLQFLFKGHDLLGVRTYTCVSFCANVRSYAITLEACFSQLALWTKFGARNNTEKKMAEFTHELLAAFLTRIWPPEPTA